MFTGIVEDLGEVEAIEHEGDSARIFIRSATVTEDARIGDSIAVNGVCLTVTALPGNPPDDGSLTPRGFVADVMGETLRLTSLKDVAPGTKVNLERSVRMEDRLGGHLVQGHVDGTGTIISRDPQEHWDVIRIALPAGISKYVAHKGSIAVDGISLTVSAVSPSPPGATTPPGPLGEESERWFEVSLIPETLKRTTLGAKQPGEPVNLEVDMIAKYVEKLLGGAQ
jgi:riboflavin synthase